MLSASSRTHLLGIVFVSGAAALSCYDKKSDPVPAPAVAVATKDVSLVFRKTLANPAPPALQEGERIYFEDSFGSEVVQNSWPPADFMVKLWQSDEAKWGKQFSKYGWIVDPGDDLPVGLKRGTKDATRVHENCATCHVTVLEDGRAWSGMPAVHLDWSGFRIAIDDAWVAAGFPPMLNETARKKTLAVQQPGASNADSPADTRVVPADFPLYVNLGLRRNLGYTGAGRDVRSQCLLSILTMGPGQAEELPFPEDDVTGPLVAYLAWTTTPKPLTTDVEAATRGKTVFERERCNSCHHVDDLSQDAVAEWFEGPELRPGDDPAHPLGTIATDRNFYSLSDASSAAGAGPGPGLERLLRFIVERRLKIAGTNGYAVTDLHALFASAPYLHNGSVPTLEDLLKPPAERPATFTREGHTVDTSKEGMSNKGHSFGTGLPANEKTDLIAFLRSL